MNKRNVLKVAKAIEDAAKAKKGLRGVGFNMAAFASKNRNDQIDSCGTTACIAGWTRLVCEPSMTGRKLLSLVRAEGWSVTDFPKQAAEHLGLSRRQASALFKDQEFIGLLSDISPTQAVRVLRHLAKTGKVDWSKAGAP